MRRAARKDTTHGPITEGLQRAGYLVFDVSKLPNLGFDVLTYSPSRNRWKPLELKSDKKIHHKSAVTRVRPSQVKAAQLAPIPMAETLTEALLLLEKD